MALPAEPTQMREFITARLKDLYCPFPVRRADRGATTEEDLAAWCNEKRIADILGHRSRAEFPELLRRFGLCDMMTLAFPGLGSSDLRIMDRWEAIAVAIEYSLENGAQKPEFGEELARMLHSKDIPSKKDVPPNSVAECAAELLRQVQDRYGVRWRREIGNAWGTFVDATVWETLSNQQNRVADLCSYLHLRPHTYGLQLFAVPALMMQGIDCDARFLRHVCATSALWAARTQCGLVNDLIGYAKEASQGATNSNAVLICQRQYHMSASEAFTYVLGLCNDQVRSLMHLERELTTIAAELFPAEQAQVACFTSTLRYAVAGNLEWTRNSSRYTAWSEDEPLPVDARSRPHSR
ncbi:hypothetical protein DMH18_26170 [Streptomyces sp. WAC 06783]|uniref:terpene synthase family protein n=1 Tax=Streptomyces sp. WAC 06783 TaxID=2203211 RepID=UPI000F741B14|nr:hypothetical protein [Streptomyces sp. WAC 06783]RSO06941.1 hypothetical protein DMH18_26170 [Streptomyces sp. WAC 06783]